MKFSYKNIRLFSLVLGVLFIIYIVFSIVKGLIAGSNAMSTRKATLRSIPSEFMNLFNDRNIFKNAFTELSTVRYPISYFDYDNNKYSIVVTKINSIKNILLDTLIKEEFNNENIDERGGYLMVSQFRYNLYYLPKSLKASNILLDLNGDSITSVIKNDTVKSYYFKMKSFSLKYEKSSLDDLFGIAHGTNVPAYIVFLKRNESLYFIFMSVNYDDSLQPKSLNTLLLGSQ
jgi:hypothetical protein